MKIYTKLGDSGKTSLLDERVSKCDSRIETIGQIDELMVSLAFLIEEIRKINNEVILQDLEKIYKNLFIIQSAVADSKKQFDYNMQEKDIKKLEDDIDTMTEYLPKLKHFICYTGCSTSMLCHMIRAKVRSVERQVVSVYENNDISNLILIYINRLSDYFYTLARFINVQSGREEDIIKI